MLPMFVPESVGIGCCNDEARDCDAAFISSSVAFVGIGCDEREVGGRSVVFGHVLERELSPEV